MKHLKTGRKFGRPTRQRKALLQSLASSLINHGRIKTTEAKAKELRPYVEKMVTQARSSSLHSKRLIRSKLGSHNKNLFERASKYKERNGGYLRITKLGKRASDAAPMAIIEFV